MARRRKRNLPPVGWIAAGIGTVSAAGAGTYLLVRWLLRRTETPSVGPTPIPPIPPEPRPSPTPTPSPPTPVDACDPFDATTWPAGYLCVHDGTRFVFVPSDAPPVSYETACEAIVGGDHSFPGETHDALTPNDQHRLNAAVALGRPSASGLRMQEGLKVLDIFVRHDHTIDLDSGQIDALGRGETIQVVSSTDHGHRHPVVLRCTTKEA